MTWRGAGLGLAALVLVGAGVQLRVAQLDLGWFGVDQARDVATALDVAAGREAPIVGPTMRRVVRLGAGYYYFWAVPYLVSSDPLAGYWFAAALSVVAMLVVAALAQRLWGPRSALLTLAFAATHPVWVIDGRVAWAPAALPAVGAWLLWLLLAPRTGRLGVGRAAAVGAILGLAVQLHLAMAAWVLAVGLVVLLERPPARVLLAGAACGLVVGAPALLALVVGSAHDGGLASLDGAGALDLVARARGMLGVGWRVPIALGRWPDGAVGGPWLVTAAATMTLLAALGLGRLLGRTGTRSARLVLAVAGIGGGLVMALPGEAWWYYLDALLPVAALAAGAVAAPAGGRRDATGGGRVESRVTTGAVLAGVAASVVLAAELTSWLASVERHGYMAVEPRLLTLDTQPGDDAAAPGRMVSVRWQRAFAEHVAAATSGDVATVWSRLHGPALGDVAGDNGFWLRRALAGRGRADGPATHLAVWYADAPPVPGRDAMAEATDAREITALGPLRVARYTPAVDYATCRTAAGPLRVPIRIVPHPKRYGDGRPARPRDLPARIDCALRPGRAAVRLVAALHGPGTIRLTAGGASSPAAAEASLCVARPNGQRVTLELELPPGAAAALDLYDVPDARCAPSARAEREIAGAAPPVL